jgi:hypothetical protein
MSIKTSGLTQILKEHTDVNTLIEKLDRIAKQQSVQKALLLKTVGTVNQMISLENELKKTIKGLIAREKDMKETIEGMELIQFGHVQVIEALRMKDKDLDHTEIYEYGDNELLEASKVKDDVMS